MIFLYYSLYVIFVLICLIMSLLILLQRGRGGGLGGAFGGGGGGNTAFGSKTGDVLTWATAIVFGVFLVVAIGLNLVSNALYARAQAIEEPAAVTTPAPTPAPVGIELPPIPVPDPAPVDDLPPAQPPAGNASPDVPADPG